MACFATGSMEGDKGLAAAEARQELTRVTRILCSIMRTIEDQKIEIPLSPSATAWWKEHKEIDAKRRDAEIAQKVEIERAERQELARLQAKYGDS